jgi:hypothetical protein
MVNQGKEEITISVHAPIHRKNTPPGSQRQRSSRSAALHLKTHDDSELTMRSPTLKILNHMQIVLPHE